MKTSIVLTVAVLANSVGMVCLSKGMKQSGASGPLGAGWLVATAWHVLTNPWMVVGVALLFVFLGAYLAALSWADLSFVLPATAPAYVVTAVLSKLFLHEEISPARWAGTGLIVAGTWLVARTYSSPPVARADRVDAAQPELCRELSPEPGAQVFERSRE